MAIVEMQWNPTTRQLRQFGIACAVVLPLIGLVWRFDVDTISVLTGIGVVLAAVGWVAPAALKPLFLVLSIAAIPLGFVVGEVALMLVYFLVFVPIGLVFRLRRRDALQIAPDRSADSYWAPKKQPRNVASYYRQS